MKKLDNVVIISLLTGAIVAFVLSFIGGIFSGVSVLLLVMRVVIFTFLGSLVGFGIIMIIKIQLPELFALLSSSQTHEDDSDNKSEKNIDIVLDENGIQSFNDTVSSQEMDSNNNEIIDDYNLNGANSEQYSRIVESELVGIDESEIVSSDFEKQKTSNTNNDDLSNNNPQQLARAIQKMLKNE